MVGSEQLLQAMGYKPIGHGKMALDGPVCPDMVAAISRDALIAACECQVRASLLSFFLSFPPFIPTLLNITDYVIIIPFLT